MRGNKIGYDLVCSLGGNCAVAHNLKWKGLRFYAYPFDWTYFTEINSIYKLIESFKNNFDDILLQENLRQISQNLDHLGYIQYEDVKTNIVWPNHFKKEITDSREYLKIKQTIDKRCKRLLSHINNADKILFLFSLSYEVDIKPFIDFLSALKKLWPNKNIDLKIICFKCKKEEIIKEGPVELVKNKRPMNKQDFDETTAEWSFLDDIIVHKTIKQKVIFFIYKMRRLLKRFL